MLFMIHDFAKLTAEGCVDAMFVRIHIVDVYVLRGNLFILASVKVDM